MKTRISKRTIRWVAAIVAFLGFANLGFVLEHPDSNTSSEIGDRGGSVDRYNYPLYLELTGENVRPAGGVHTVRYCNKAIVDNDLYLVQKLLMVRCMTISKCRFDDSSILFRLTGIWSLRTLGIYESDLSDDNLAFLEDATQLRELSLNGNNITDDGLRHLSQLRHLRWIDLSHTQVTKAGIEWLATHLDDTWFLFTDEGKPSKYHHEESS